MSGESACSVRIGADTRQLDELSATISKAATQLGRSRRLIESTLTATWWRGYDAERFSRDWGTSHSPALRNAEAGLERIARVLLKQAAEQVAASASAGGGGPVEAPPQPGFAAIFSATQSELLRRPPGDELRALIGPGRQVLLIERGVAEVFGDLGSASTVGIWVPGVGTRIADFADPDSLAAKRIWAGDPGIAMIEWLGYAPPGTIAEAAIELGHGARRAGDDLNRFVAQLKSRLELTRPLGALPEIVIGGHSYGSVVAAHAAAVGTPADALVLAGSPGVPVNAAGDLSLAGQPGGPANVAVIQNPFDPVTVGHLADEALTAVALSVIGPLSPAVALGLLTRNLADRGGFTWWSQMSNDPAASAFGAQRLPANDTSLSGLIAGGNHRYADVGSASLDSLRVAFRRRAGRA